MNIYTENSRFGSLAKINHLFKVLFALILACLLFYLLESSQYTKLTPISLIKSHAHLSSTSHENIEILQSEEYLQWFHIAPTLKSVQICHYNSTRIKISKINKLKNPKYSIKYEVENNMLLLRIQEKIQGEHSNGGSTFHTSCSSKFLRWNCEYRDFFNGDYLVQCPLHKSYKTLVVVDLLGVNFTSYILGGHDVNANKRRKNNLFKKKFSPTKSNLGKLPRSIWSIQNNATYLMQLEGRNFMHPFRMGKNRTHWFKQFCSRYSALIFIGASHMRYKFDLLIEECISPNFLGNTQRYHDDISVSNLHFIWSPLSNNFSKNMLTRITKTIDKFDRRPILILAQFGTHDLAYCKTTYTLTNTLQPIFDNINNFIRTSKRTTKAVVISPPPGTGNKLLKIFALATFSKLMQMKCKELNNNGVKQMNPNVDSYLCKDGVLDAISYMDDQRTFAFRGSYAIELKDNGDYKGNVSYIKDVFHGVVGYLDAVVTLPKTRNSIARTYFFKAHLYWVKVGKSISESRPIIRDFQGIPDNVNAAFIRNQQIIFVKNDMFYHYNWQTGSTEGPVHKSKTMWKQLPSGLTAAMYNPYTKRTNYFINQYVYQLDRYNNIQASFPHVIRNKYLKCSTSSK